MRDVTMADKDAVAQETGAKRSRMPLVLGALLALAGGGGGFYAAYSGLLPWGDSGSARGGAPGAGHAAGLGDAQDGAHAGSRIAASDAVAFVPIEPLIVSLDGGGGTNLRFRAQLEVDPASRAEVEHLLPRVVDVLNGYLRAVDIADLRNNAALVRLRAQMLRRVQMVVGSDRVSDLLIMEFVLN
ncbi:MAG: flagellar basal body-associated FliL family protein [Roseovarius sp.]